MLNLKQYQLVRTIHKSDKSIVVSALTMQNQSCVIKCVNPMYQHPMAARARLDFEYQALREFNHPGIIQTSGILNEPGCHGLILEDCQASSLQNLIDSNNPFPLAQFFEISRQILSALNYLHNKGFIHKDINPSNIIFDHVNQAIKIIDFEIATRLTVDETCDFSSEYIEGTLRYISPEQTGRIDLPIDFRSDIYSLGISFFQLLTGQTPFQAEDRIGWIHAHLVHQIPSPMDFRQDLPSDLCQVILKMLEKNPRDRYQSTFGVQNDLAIVEEHWKAGTTYHFVPGKHDPKFHFELPSQVLGREKEIALLKDVFKKAVNGQLHIVAINGGSGIGKSSLAAHLKNFCLPLNGWYLKGKFEKYRADNPYIGFKQILDQLLAKWEGLSEAELLPLKNTLVKKVGVQLKALENINANFKIFTSDLPSLPTVGPKEAEDRLIFSFVQMVSITSMEQPLVLFLDDIQWADQPSINLLEKLVQHELELKILVVLAYRDHEIVENSTIHLILDQMRMMSCFHSLNLHPFQCNQTIAYLDTTFPNMEYLQSVAEYIQEKTQGVPYFIEQLLKKAVRERIIYFDHQRGKWKCEIDLIKNLSISDNMVEFLLSSVGEMDVDCQEIAKKAAILGFQFTLKDLVILSQISTVELQTALQKPYRYSIIIPCNEDGYQFLKYGSYLDENDNPLVFRFQHDRMFQACYDLLDAQESMQCHLRYARLLRQEINDSSNQDRLSDLVEHYNKAIEYIENQDEKIWLAEQNCIVAWQYFESIAYEKAQQLIDAAEGIIGSDLWSYPAIAKTICQLKSKLLMHLDKFDAAEKYWAMLLERSPLFEDKAKLFLAKLQYLILHCHKSAAIRVGLQGLKILNIKVSEKPSALRVLRECILTLPRMSFADLEVLEKKEMTSQSDKVALKILLSIAPAAYTSGMENLYVTTIMMATRLTLRKGLSEDSPLTLVYGGGLAMIAFRLHKISIKYAAFADALSTKFSDVQNVATIRFLNGAFVYSWLRPWAEITPYVKEGIEAGLKVGDFYFVKLCTLHYQHWDYQNSIDEDLDSLEQRLKFLKNLGKAEVDDSSSFLLVEQAYQRYLREAQSSMDSPEFSIREYLSIVQSNQIASAEGFIYSILMRKAWLEGKYDEALDWDDKYQKVKKGLLGLPWLVEHHLYSTLLYSDLFFQSTPFKRMKLRFRLLRNLANARYWNRIQPGNFAFVYNMIRAEYARLRDKRESCLKFYNHALTAAKLVSVVRWSAVATERLAGYWRSQNLGTLEAQAIKESYMLYRLWGSKRFMSQVEQRYPGIDFVETEHVTTHSTIMGQGSSTVLRHEDIDMEAFVTSAQVLAGEVVLEQLIDKLLGLAHHHSGSDRVLLILKDFKSNEYFVQGEVINNQVHSGQRILVSSFSPLATAYVNYVLRNPELKIVNDVPEEMLTTDYIGNPIPESLAILPIIHKGELAGLLYLENHMLKNVYSKSRMVLLKILSSQMAISLQNALLFEQMKDKIWLENELAAAKAVQETLIPTNSRFDEFELASYYQSADSTGGDWFWYQFNENKKQLFVMIGDVTGHGIPSALVTGTASGSIQACLQLLSESENDSPASILLKMANVLNQAIYFTGRKADRYMTMSFLCFDLQHMRGYYLNAGHNSFIHASGENSKSILAPGAILGISQDAKFGCREFPIRSQDSFLLYTDGLIENGGTSRSERLSTKKLSKILNQKSSATEGVKNIEQQIVELWQNHKPDDDTTFLVIKILKADQLVNDAA